ncbi:YdcF family protein [Paenibacillus sp. 1P03SA]|uniref:YdcF family protein n=1 Tax=Paenibacillus sp. 1P03SA TaxID=3132294 RepID=UPI00399F1891
MQPHISKDPEVPELNEIQINQLTNIVFLGNEIAPCDAIFVFGGTHPGHWESTIDAYKKGLGKKIIVTGGVSPTGIKHKDWEDKTVPEAHVIVKKLLDAGIPSNIIVYEDRSRNTLENVLFSKEVFDFNTIESILMVCKAHGAGRQYRTLAKHLPQEIKYFSYGFESSFDGQTINRENWMHSSKGRSRVYGEYLRICFYGDRGDILQLEQKVEGLPNVTNN